MKMRARSRSPHSSSEDEDRPSDQPTVCSKGAGRKTTRYIELGWIHNGRQVRARNGGGTLKLAVLKKTDYEDLLQKGKELFFPGGWSTKGSVEQFTFKIWSFMEKEMSYSATVGTMYQKMKMGILRFYLASFDINSDSSSNEDSQDQGEQQQCHTEYKQESDAFYVNGERNSSDEYKQEGKSSIKEENDFSYEYFNSVNDEEYKKESDDQAYDACQGNGEGSEGQRDGANKTEEGEPSGAEQPGRNGDKASSSSAGGLNGNHDAPVQTKLLRLRRVNDIVQVMLKEFTDPQIMANNRVLRFVDENGEDASRYAFAAFWTAFFHNYSNGDSERVPALCPEFGREQWEALGRVLATGLSKLSYFPIQMSFSFVVAMVYGEAEVTADMLMESFLRYLTEVERRTIQAALHGSEVDQEELLDIFCRMGSRTVPSKDNLSDVLLQIAHKQIIQEPHYALVTIAKAAQASLKAALPTAADLERLYSKKRPTANKVLNLLCAQTTSGAHIRTMKHLKLFIRSLDPERLSKFLRFVTGADVICVDKISVEFTDERGPQRRPVAHPGGPLLQVPSTYNNFTELRRDFVSVMESQWLSSCGFEQDS